MAPCSWSAAARPAASSRRNCTRQVARSCSRCGRAPWSPRRVGRPGLGLVAASRSGFLDAGGGHAARAGGAPLRERAGDRAAAAATTSICGCFATAGVTLVGPLRRRRGRAGRTPCRLISPRAWRGETTRYRQLADLFAEARAHRGRASAQEPEPFDAYVAGERRAAGVSAPSIFTTGFRPDYASWLPWHGRVRPTRLPATSTTAASISRRRASTSSAPISFASESRRS